MRLARLSTYMLVAMCSLFAAACGGSGDGDDVADDTGDDTTEGEHYKYVADSASIPTTLQQVTEFGLDIDSDQPDGDVGVDNQLGSVLNALAQMGFTIQATVTESIAVGDIILLADYQTTAFDNATGAGFQIYLGDNPNPAACTDETDEVCGHHLEGGAMFDIADGSPTDARVTGDVVSSVFTGGPGTLALQIALSAGAPIQLDLIGARAEVRGASATGIDDGKIAGAVTEEQITNDILPAVATQLGDTIAEDCPTPAPPDCGCEPDSTGETLINTFDANDDCALTAAELAENPLIMGFLTPDVTIDGVDALSIGLKFTAVTAVYTAP